MVVFCLFVCLFFSLFFEEITVKNDAKISCIHNFFNCIRCGPLGPNISFFEFPVKMRKDIFFLIAEVSITHLLVKKKIVICAIFRLISIY